MTIAPPPAGFDLPQKPDLPEQFTPDSLTTYVDFWEKVKGICDWHIGEALVQAKKDLGHGKFMDWYKARGWNAQQVANLVNWYDNPHISQFAKFEIEKVTTRGARRALVKTDPIVQQATANYVTEANQANETVQLSAAEFNELQRRASTSELHAKDRAKYKLQVQRLEAELKDIKSGKKQLGLDPAVARKNLARDHERAMTMDAGTRRQEIERYFDLRNDYSEEGRIYMDAIVKRLFKTLQANLTTEGDPLNDQSN